MSEAYQLLAQQASLRYVSDTIPGIRRIRRGRGYQYVFPDGETLSDDARIERINALAIPPAYSDVWICPFDNGHLQATGRDDKRRKQYRYHPEWETVRDQQKFDVLAEFGDALPDLRERIDADMSASRKDSRRAVLAAMVYMLDTAHLRIGTRAYARAHQTYGLTTLRKKHVKTQGAHVVLDFVGKNKTDWQVSLKNRRLAKIIQKCEDIPGYSLFKYIDSDGERHDVHSEDVNAYLQDITQHDFTAKVFRTWAACVQLYARLLETPVPESQRKQQIAYNKAVKRVAKKLGHTVAVCKRSYLMPELFDSWLDGSLVTGDDAEDAFLQWYKRTR